MQNSNTKMNKKTYKHGTPDNSDSEASDIEMSIPFCKRKLKKRSLILSSSESEDSSIRAAPKQTKRKTKFFWTCGHFQPRIYEFDIWSNGIQTNIAKKSSILEMFQMSIFGKVNRIHCRTD